MGRKDPLVWCPYCSTKAIPMVMLLVTVKGGFFMDNITKVITFIDPEKTSYVYTCVQCKYEEKQETPIEIEEDHEKG